MNYPKVLLVGGPDVDARLDLMQCLRSEFDLSVAGSSPKLQGKFSAAGFDYYEYTLGRGFQPLVELSTIVQLTHLFRHVRPTVVHTFDTRESIWGRLAARMAGVPIAVGTLPGLGSLYTNDSLATRLLRSGYQPLQKLACHLADLTIFQNHHDAQQFISADVVPKRKATVIPGSGVRTDLFDPAKVSPSDRERVRAELGIQPDELVVTMISRLIRSKGVLDFAEAAQTVKRWHRRVCFLLVGPPDEDSIDRLTPTEVARLTQTVVCPGLRHDIPVVLALSDIFALPSFYREGIPRVLLEAASMGLPLVTTDSPGCSEVVEHGVNGLLVPVRDSDALAQAILCLVEEPEMRQRFGQKSRERAIARFDLCVIAGQICSIYRELLVRKGLLPARKT